MIKAKIEDVHCVEPNSVDILVSEPLGFYLYNERMLETYIIARNKFLRPTGLMFPSKADLFVMPFSDESLYAELVNASEFWHSTNNFHGLDLTCLAESATDERLSQPVIDCYDPNCK